MAINLGKPINDINQVDENGLKINKTVTSATLPNGKNTIKNNKKSSNNLLDDGYQFGDFSKMFWGEAGRGASNLINNIVSLPGNTINTTKNILKESEALQDGYQFGDGLKTIGSTLLSGAQNFGEGVIRGGEQLVDAGADLFGGISDHVNTKLEKAVGLHKSKTESEINKEKANSRKKMIATNYTDELMKTVGKDDEYKDLVESNSLIKSDNMGGAIAQELGRQSLNLLINNKVGSNNKLIQSLPMLTGSYGSGMEEAYQNGATTSEARRYGILNAATETATEWVTGGIPGLKGSAGKGLDGLASKIIGEPIEETSKSLSKALLKSGYKLIGEGTEEALSEYINPYIKQFTYEYNNDKDVLGNFKEAHSKVSPQDMITSFIMGAITAGIIDAPNNLSDIKSGYVNGKIAKLNTKQNNINNYSENTANLNNLQSSNINNQESINSSQNSLNVTNNNLLNNDANTLSKPIYQYIPSDNQKINNLRESASKYFDNSVNTQNLVNTFEKIIKDKNYNVVFDNTISNESGNQINAQIKMLDNGEMEIRINPNSDRAGEFLIMHEVTHAIETSSMKKLVLDYASKNKEFNQALKSLKKTYGTEDVSSEVLADISGQLFGNQEFINNLSMEKPNIFKKIYNSIVSLANKITGNSKESLFIKDLKNKWEEAYRNTNVEQAANNLKNDVKSSKGKLISGEDIIVSDDINGSHPSKQIAEKNLKSMLGIKYLNSNSNTEISIENKDIKKYLNDGYNNQKNMKLKKRISGNYGEILEIAQIDPDKSQPNYKGTNRGKQGFDYYDVNLAYPIKDNNGKIINYKYYESRLVVRKDNDNNFAYDLDNFKEKKGAVLDKTSLSIMADKSADGSFLNDNVPQSNKNVKSNSSSSTKYSMKKNTNNTLETDNSTWQNHLEENYKATGTRTNMKDYRLLSTPNNNSEIQKVNNNPKKETIKEINQKKIDNNTNAINRLNQEKNAMISRIQDKIKTKKDLLKSKTNLDTKLATQLNIQISNLNNQLQNRKLDYDRRIEYYQNKNNKMNSKEFKIQEQRMTKKQEYINQAYEMTENMIDWKDKDRGIKYKINTMKRNLYDIMPKSEADRMYNTYFQPITENNAKSEKFINNYNERINNLKLTNEESAAVQMLGEYKYNKETLVTGAQVDDYISSNNLNYDKISSAVEEFRNIYDELIVETNKVLKEQGYKEIEYRKGYFPHFQEETRQGKFAKLAEKLGFNTNKNDQTLPTDIAGMTEIFKPGKTYFKNAQQRKGKITDYNALKGYDNYIRGAADLIFHTEDIQKLRALENVIRTQYTDSSIQKRLEDIYNNEGLDQEQKEKLVDEEYLKINNPLPNFVTELRDYTDTLANKKDIGDRGIEHMLGRETYTIMKDVQSRVSANMVGFNISSALTNFIPITQAWGEVSTKNMFKAIRESIANQFHDDGFADCSTYLINRTKTADRLYKTKLEDINSKAGVIFEGIDSITSNAIVRGKYYDNIDKGMTQEQAIKNANEFAKDIMAGRNKGDMPTIFNRKSPIIKLFTAFQLEVNNQYGYMLKDLPRNLSDEAKNKLVGAFVKMFVGAWLYNKFSEAVVGRKSAFSPIDIASETIQTVQEDSSIYDKLSSISNIVVSELPFVGGVMGGGRLPIQAAMPDIGTTIESVTQLSDSSKKNKAIKNLVTELSKPIFYVAMPFGGGQLKKTIEGASMYTHDVPGSYTSTGKLRFTVKKDPLSVAQSLLFGQYSSKEAREYFNAGYAPLTEKQTKEFKKLNVSINTYRKYRTDLTELNKIKSDRVDGKTISGTSAAKKAYQVMNNDDYSEKEKQYLLNNISSSENKLTIKDLNKIANNEDVYKHYFSLSNDNKKEYLNAIEKYNFDSYQLYDYSQTKKRYEEQYASSKAKEMIIDYLVSSDLSNDQKQYLYNQDYGSKENEKIFEIFNIDIDNYLNTMKYSSELKFDYQGNKYSDYRKQQTFKYIQNLNASVIEKIILFKQAGYSVTSYKSYIYNYINNLSISQSSKAELWNQLF